MNPCRMFWCYRAMRAIHCDSSPSTPLCACSVRRKWSCHRKTSKSYFALDKFSSDFHTPRTWQSPCSRLLWTHSPLEFLAKTSLCWCLVSARFRLLSLLSRELVYLYSYQVFSLADISSKFVFSSWIRLPRVQGMHSSTVQSTQSIVLAQLLRYCKWSIKMV